MPYAVKFYAYIFVANVLAFVIVARWLEPFGFMASIAFGLVFDLSADCYRSVGVWAKGIVKSALAGLIQARF